ncbi:aliphatic sulfonate ABC transporter substrate-binding protein [Paenibacillus sp. LMG 31456]|uniref:Aliphatic sulfonate ABC transporter substrate-binding protein n=1 Tax=Paenibacillus foliorum TaxID=2654974 RepID=A0A972GR31_9BACL|nr:ABC transporter substrate-binding protein [Paenibacillus foliorum]NOU95284.1 aliphatic sulfonate ABC transporter substrate-binding protein [Paenibacillus foliorum]
MKKNMSLLLAIMLVTVLVLSACGKKEEPAKDGAAAPKASAPASTVRLGIFKNVTHAPGYVALEQGLFQKYWGENVKIEVTAFDNGSDFSTALATDQIDLGYTGPGPATNQFLKSKNFRIVSGSNNGGAVLVAAKDSGITSPKDLLGKTVAIPTKGSTNEISLRLLLKENNLNVTTDKTGVQIIARAPADTLIAMRQKEIEATLVPEPWGTQMEQEGIGKIIVDWNKIPPNNGDYPLTLLAASDKFLKEHRDMVKQAIKANADAVDFIKKNPDKSYELINNRLKALSGKGMEINLIKAAISRLNLTTDVNKAAIEEMAKVSIDAGYIKDIKKEELDLSKFLDLSLLEEVKAGK